MPYNNVLTCHEQRAVALRGMASNESCCIAAGWLVQKSGWKQYVTRGQPTSCQKSKEGMIVASIVLLGCVCLVFFFFSV